MDDTKDFIQINNVSFTYQSDEEDSKAPSKVLDDVSLNIKKGEFVAIVGRNGSGKSTLSLHLNALLVPTEGDVIVDGYNTKDDNSIWDIRKRIGIVFQNPDNQLVSSIIEDDVAFGPENMGIEPKEIRTRVDEALAAVNMTEYAKKAPHLLSGGQKQRVAIAGVIAMKPECIVFDEATAMLDPMGRKDILEIIKSLHKDGHTIIMITHFMQEAVCADRVIVLSNGKIALEGTPREVFSQEEMIKKLDLEMPFAIELSDQLRELGISVPETICTEEELLDYLCSLK